MMVLVVWCMYNLVTAKCNVTAVRYSFAFSLSVLNVFPESDKIGFRLTRDEN